MNSTQIVLKVYKTWMSVFIKFWVCNGIHCNQTVSEIYVVNWRGYTVPGTHWNAWLPVNSSHGEVVTRRTRHTVNSSQWIRHQKVKSSHSERVTAYSNTITILSRSNISQYELIYQLTFPPSTFSRLWPTLTADFISLFCRTCLAPYCRAI